MADSIPGKRPTITDVARLAGVSTASASKVLRETSGVSAATRTAVRAAMEELHYRPHAAARGMRGRTYTVGVVMSDLGNPFFPELVNGITSEIESTGYQVLLGPGGPGGATQRRMAEAMLDRQMDGLVLIAPSIGKSDIAAIAREKPVVVLGRHGAAEEYDSVFDDDTLGATLVVDHLVEYGHRRIAHVGHRDASGETQGTQAHSVRAEGYRSAMRAHGLGDEIDVVQTAYTEEGGYLGAVELLGREKRPTAIFAGADVAAIGVLRAIFEAGLTVPGDVSVASYDNTSIAALRPISLTSVDQSGRTMGSSAARMLLERIEGRTRSVSLSVSPVLVTRATTGPNPEL